MRSPARLSILIAVVVSASAPHATGGPEPDSWIGRRVILKELQSLKIRIGRQAERNWYFRVYRVEKTRGPWLWLVSEIDDDRGWATADGVLPLEKANDHYTEAIRTHPSARNYVERGNVWSEWREYDKAIDDYTEAIRLEPRNGMIYYNRGLAWTANGIGYLNRDLAWSAKEDLDRAIADYSQAIQLGARDPSVYRNRAFTWFHEQEYGKALADYSQVVQLDPKAASTFISIASIQAVCPVSRLRDGKKAVAAATRACELTGWKRPRFLATLAAAYAEAGDFARAVQWQKKAIALAGDDPERQDKLRAQLALYEAKKPYRFQPGSH